MSKFNHKNNRTWAQNDKRKRLDNTRLDGSRKVDGF